MKTTLITIQHAAQRYKIASVRIDGLIRQGKIVKCVQTRPYTREQEVLVDTAEIDRYFFENPGVLEEWQTNFQTTQNGYRL